MTDEDGPSGAAPSSYLTEKQAKELFSSMASASNEDIFYYRNRERLLASVWATIVGVGALAGVLIAWLGVNTVQGLRDEAIEAARLEAGTWVANRSDIIDREIRNQLDIILPQIAEDVAAETVEGQLSSQSDAIIQETLEALEGLRTASIKNARAEFISIFPVIRSLEEIEADGSDLAAQFHDLSEGLASIRMQAERSQIATEAAFEDIERLREQELAALQSQVGEHEQRILDAETDRIELVGRLDQMVSDLAELDRISRISNLSCELFTSVIPTDALSSALNPVPPDDYPELAFQLQQIVSQIRDECYY